MSQKQLVKDLSSHFRERVAEIVEDEMDTCRRMDVSYDDTMAITSGHLLGIAAIIAIENDVKKEDWLHGCSVIYDRMKKANPR